MYAALKLAFKYIKYYLASSNGKGHGVHSPFVYDFILNVLNDEKQFPWFFKIEWKRKSFLASRETVTVEDFGAGSHTLKDTRRMVGSIARTSLKPPRYAKLLSRIVNYYQPLNVIELGTSLGITTSYLAGPGQPVFTIEGSTAIAELAEKSFRHQDIKNIRLYKGTFSSQLPRALSDAGSVGLAYIDGDHRKAQTLEYFETLLQHSEDSSIFIFDDIHWSPGMEQAWESIKQHPRVRLTIDLFFIGLVFFRKEFKVKQHFTIRF